MPCCPCLVNALLCAALLCAAPRVVGMAGSCPVEGCHAMPCCAVLCCAVVGCLPIVHVILHLPCHAATAALREGAATPVGHARGSWRMGSVSAPPAGVTGSLPFGGSYALPLPSRMPVYNRAVHQGAFCICATPAGSGPCPEYSAPAFCCCTPHPHPPPPPPLAGELLYSETVGPPLWFPPAVIAKGPAVPFIGGAPLVLSAPPLPGYSELPGTNQFAFTGGSFNCSFTEL